MVLFRFKNLSFLQVYEAGHMVPMNQPEAALALLNEFIAMKGPAAGEGAEAPVWV